MSSRNIRPAADRFPYLFHFLDLFSRDAPWKETAGVAPLQGFTPNDTGQLKSVYEKALDVLEKRAAELGFRNDLLQLQRDLYSEMEYVDSLPHPDSRHHFLVVVPVADRPSMLRQCMESLVGQCEDFGYGGIAVDGNGNRFFRKVSLFVIDDSAEEDNRIRIREAASEAARRGVRAYYVGVEEQSDLLRHVLGLAGESSSSLTGRPGNGRGRHKGASVTRNLAYLYLNSFIRRQSNDERFLIYFLDSDEEFGIKVLRNGGGADVRFINYFYWLDRIFSTTDVQVVTGKVVGDPPVSPSVMINTFLDDVLLFLEEASRCGPDKVCPFHGAEGPGAFSAEYHDMVELFGYERPGALSYDCPLSGDHTAGDCFRAFSRDAVDFFHGLHPTRVQFYRHAGRFIHTEGARTVYTGNYVLTPEALKYFIPFADLKLRMAGPTLGRILKSRIGGRFASANLPLLHRRTNPDSSRVYRSGISGSEESVDLSGEFIRQFWGDVMLFSIESLARSGFPGRRPDLSEISRVVESVQGDIWKLYREQKAAAAAKAAAARDRLLRGDNWWNKGTHMDNAVGNMELVCSMIDVNFGEGSKGMKSISAQIDQGSYTNILIGAIHSFHDDELVWEKLLEADMPVQPG